MKNTVITSSIIKKFMFLYLLSTFILEVTNSLEKKISENITIKSSTEKNQFLSKNKAEVELPVPSKEEAESLAEKKAAETPSTENIKLETINIENIKPTDSTGTDTIGTGTSEKDTTGIDTSETGTSETDTTGRDTSKTETSGTDTSETETKGTDTSETDGTGTDTTELKVSALAEHSDPMLSTKSHLTTEPDSKVSNNSGTEIPLLPENYGTDICEDHGHGFKNNRGKFNKCHDDYLNRGDCDCGHKKCFENKFNNKRCLGYQNCGKKLCRPIKHNNKNICDYRNRCFNENINEPRICNIKQGLTNHYCDHRW